MDDVHKFGGKGTGVRFVGLNERVRSRFGRFGWGVYDAGKGQRESGATAVYGSVGEAVVRRGRGTSVDEDGIEAVEVMVVGGDKEKV